MKDIIITFEQMNRNYKPCFIMFDIYSYIWNYDSF